MDSKSRRRFSRLTRMIAAAVLPRNSEAGRRCGLAASAALITLLMVMPAAMAAVIQGNITGVKNSQIWISFPGNQQAAVGDKVTVVWELDGQELNVGQAVIREVSPGYAMAQVLSGQPTLGMQARVQTSGHTNSQNNNQTLANTSSAGQAGVPANAPVGSGRGLLWAIAGVGLFLILVLAALPVLARTLLGARPAGTAPAAPRSVTNRRARQVAVSSGSSARHASRPRPAAHAASGAGGSSSSWQYYLVPRHSSFWFSVAVAPWLVIGFIYLSAYLWAKALPPDQVLWLTYASLFVMTVILGFLMSLLVSHQIELCLGAVALAGSVIAALFAGDWFAALATFLVLFPGLFFGHVIRMKSGGR